MKNHITELLKPEDQLTPEEKLRNEAELYINKAIRSGKIKNEPFDKGYWIARYTENPKLAKNFIDQMKQVYENKNLTSVIAKEMGGLRNKFNQSTETPAKYTSIAEAMAELRNKIYQK